MTPRRVSGGDPVVAGIDVTSSGAPCAEIQATVQEHRPMQRTVRAYEKPSRISQAVVVCLSIAVVVAAGRLASTIVLSRYVTTSAVHDTDTASAPVSVESVSPEPYEPPVAARVNPAYVESLPQDDASTAPTPPRSALPLAPLAEPPSAATPNPGFAPWLTAAPDVDFRAGEATGAMADLLRAPPYAAPPAAEGRVASIPVPRPRPRLDSEDVQSDPDQSPFSAFDLFVDRQR
jgi:hypothetical protein